MVRDYCCVSIPMELFCYKKVQKIIMETPEPILDVLEPNVKINKSSRGEIESVEYFLANSINKKVFYNGASICKIEYYKKNQMFLKEEFSNEKLIRKSLYNDSYLESVTNYKYNSKGKIIELQKSINNNEYQASYGYDDLHRVNSRKIYVNNSLWIDQHYRFDILDRISEYVDSNQRVKVTKIDTHNRLVSYIIMDKFSNEIIINNRFSEGCYLSTDVILNGHSTTVCDTSYVDNVILKRPYTSENDLDLIISNLIKSFSNQNNKSLINAEECSKKNDEIVNTNVLSRAYPISMRKRALYYFSNGL